MTLVTVIMPTRNELHSIEAALDAILAQRVPGPLEVVIADGRSDDGTRELVVRRAAADARIVLVDNPERGTPEGLNHALQAARGRYIVRVDGHTIIPPGYVRKMLAHLQSGRAEAAGGLQIAVGRGRFGRAVAALHGSRLGIGGGRQHHALRPEYVDHITQGAYVTELCRRIGGFDERWTRNQDCEFDLRYAAAGGRLLLDPALGYCWYVRESPRRLARQYYQYGFWRCRTVASHPASLRLRYLVAPGLVAALVLAALAAPTPVGPLPLLVVAGAYAGGVIAGSASLVRRTGILQAPHVVVALATVHLSWGAGFLASLPGALRMRRGRPRLAAFVARRERIAA
jgi:succinoglycan biosynthesis protein ExoA